MPFTPDASSRTQRKYPEFGGGEEESDIIYEDGYPSLDEEEDDGRARKIDPKQLEEILQNLDIPEFQADMILRQNTDPMDFEVQDGIISDMNSGMHYSQQRNNSHQKRSINNHNRSASTPPAVQNNPLANLAGGLPDLNRLNTDPMDFEVQEDLMKRLGSGLEANPIPMLQTPPSHPIVAPDNIFDLGEGMMMISRQNTDPMDFEIQEDIQRKQVEERAMLQHSHV